MSASDHQLAVMVADSTCYGWLKKQCTSTWKRLLLADATLRILTSEAIAVEASVYLSFLGSYKDVLFVLVRPS